MAQKSSKEISLYGLLGVNKGASSVEIKSAYKKLALVSIKTIIYLIKQLLTFVEMASRQAPRRLARHSN